MIEQPLQSMTGAWFHLMAGFPQWRPTVMLRHFMQLIRTAIETKMPLQFNLYFINMRALPQPHQGHP